MSILTTVWRQIRQPYTTALGDHLPRPAPTAYPTKTKQTHPEPEPTAILRGSTLGAWAGSFFGTTTRSTPWSSDASMASVSMPLGSVKLRMKLRLTRSDLGGRNGVKGPGDVRGEVRVRMWFRQLEASRQKVDSDKVQAVQCDSRVESAAAVDSVAAADRAATAASSFSVADFAVCLGPTCRRAESRLRPPLWSRRIRYAPRG